ncbi:ThiF family adenylyltransferase [Capnocytophaga canimorsus]|uniref:tRNA threonylcarbamoyladenosine dehydratase n=1 Tax=Capnocytophaga canimorsus TaxID=28188 RepID=UPI0037D4C244
MEMKNWLERTELLVKSEGIEKLKSANILIVGLGGVGSFAAEFIARSGVGKMTIVDGDSFDVTNINRQLPALHSTLGKSKAKVLANRLLDINPELKLTVLHEFLSPERAFELVSSEFDYVLDCIDSITPKLNLIKAAKTKKIKLISSMGAGGVLDPSKVMVTDIRKTRDCPLAKNIRKRLKKEGIHSGFKAVFSTEVAPKDTMQHTDGTNFKKSFYGTISYMPATFGLHAAATVIQYLLNHEETE